MSHMLVNYVNTTLDIITWNFG